MEFNATFIVSAISFIAFTLIMNAILYNPLEKIVDERKKFIDGNLADAKDASDKSVALQTERDNKLNSSKKDAKKLMSDKTSEANSQKDSLTSSAKKKANADIESAKNELENSKTDARNALNNEVVNMAQMISDKILGDNIPINQEEVING